MTNVTFKIETIDYSINLSDNRIDGDTKLNIETEDEGNK